MNEEEYEPIWYFHVFGDPQIMIGGTDKPIPEELVVHLAKLAHMGWMRQYDARRCPEHDWDEYDLDEEIWGEGATAAMCRHCGIDRGEWNRMMAGIA